MREMQTKLGVATRVSEIIKLCGRPAKLPNMVSAAVVGFIYFWRKMKAFRPLEGRRCDEIQFEWVHLVNYYSQNLLSC